MHPFRSLAIGTYLRAREALLRLGVWLRQPALERDIEAYREMAHDRELKHLLPHARTFPSLDNLAPGADAASIAGINIANRLAQQYRGGRP